MKYSVRCSNRSCWLQAPAYYDQHRLAAWLKEAHEQNAGHTVEIVDGNQSVQSPLEHQTGKSGQAGASAGEMLHA